MFFLPTCAAWWICRCGAWQTRRWRTRRWKYHWCSCPAEGGNVAVSLTIEWGEVESVCVCVWGDWGGVLSPWQGNSPGRSRPASPPPWCRAAPLQPSACRWRENQKCKNLFIVEFENHGNLYLECNFFTRVVCLVFVFFTLCSVLSSLNGV